MNSNDLFNIHFTKLISSGYLLKYTKKDHMIVNEFL